MSKDSQATQALQYLLDEGFISFGFRDGEPAVFLTTTLEEAQKAIKAKAMNDPSDWWKEPVWGKEPARGKK
jgi:hypothetical protein